MKDILNLGIRLMVIALIAGLLLGATNMLTEDRIAQQNIRRANEARMAVMPGNESFDAIMEDAAAVSGITGIFACPDGYVYTVKEKGYGSAGVTATVGILKDGSITGVRFDASAETPGLGAKAATEGYYGQYAGLTADTLSRVNAISGATITSNAASGAVEAALEHFNNNYR